MAGCARSKASATPESVKSDGRVMIGEQYYYVQKALAGERVVLEVDADTGELVVWHRKVPIKRLERKRIEE